MLRFSHPLTRLALAGMIVCGAWAVPQVHAQTQMAMKIDAAPQSHALIPALRRASEALKAAEAVRDYEATFTKKEMIDGSMKTSQMQLKLREKPLSVYLRYVSPNEGREVIYVEGKNNGNLLVHETGLAALVGTLSLDPHGSLAMGESRHPVTMIGIRNMTQKVMEQWLSETKYDDMTVNYYPNAKIGSMACRVIETSHASKKADTLYAMTRLYIDADMGLPIRVQQYDFASTPGEKPVLVGDYSYMNLQPNVGLGEIDFDTRNPTYGF